MFSFIYDNVVYTVVLEGCNHDRILLPTGVLVEVTYWLESHPPQIGGLQVIELTPDLTYATANVAPAR